jgi:hypothetical protein
MGPSEENAFRQPAATAQSAAEYLLGDYCTLLRELMGDSAPVCNAPLGPPATRMTDFSALQNFLNAYLAEILLPLELPAVAEACGRVRRGQLRELIALDRQIAGEKRLAPFASASRKIGVLQLQRLRPLRDERTVRRYLSAVESGEADGWHTLVYGLTLAVYSFPLRQGLLHYARETLGGLMRTASTPELSADARCGELLTDMFCGLPAAIEPAVAAAHGEIAP